MKLAAHFQRLAIELQKVAMGQAAFGVTLCGPRVAEVDVDAVHLTGYKEIGQLIGICRNKNTLDSPAA